MTDGYIGNDFEVIDLVRDLRDRSRWFPFGTGNSTNRFLLEQMARQGGGEVDYVLLSDSGEAVARKFWARIDAPVLTDVRLDFEGLDVRDVTPLAPSDVWGDRPLVIHARYRRGGRGRVGLSGYQGGRPYRHVLDVTLPEREERNGAIASIWARARVEELMSRDLSGLQSGSFSGALRDQVEAVALRHGIVTPFTSFVAVEDRVVNPGGESTRVVVPVELPQGVSREGVFGAADAASKWSGKVARMASSQAALALRPDYKRRSRTRLSPRENQPAEAPAASGVLTKHARERLAPALLALLEGGSAAELGIALEGDRVRVEIELEPGASETLARLEEAGLRITQTSGMRVTGAIALEKLAALAELDGVAKISPA